MAVMFLAMLAANDKAFAAACVSQTDGNWNVAGTWNTCNGTFPGAGDTVTIRDRDDVTVTANAAAASVTIPGGTNDSSIRINPGISLTVSGAVTLTSNSNNDWKEIRVGSGSFSVGSITLNSNGASRVAQITLSTGTVNVSGDISFTGTTASAQRLAYTGAGVINLAGDLGGGGTLTTVTGSVFNFNGSAPQTAAGYTTYNILGMNNPTGLTITGNTTTVALNLTSGTITTGANTLEVSSNCTTGITGNASSYVVGNLRLHYPTNSPGTTTCTYPIGDATAYTPVTNAMVNVSSTLANSTLTARTDTPDHASLGTSTIDGTKSVNRTWTLTPGGALAFTSYSPTFNFVAGDIDSGAVTGSFIVGKENGGGWTYPTVDTRTATSTQATGITAASGFGAFALGEPNQITGTVFEDINYTGGAGRDLATSGGTVIPNARVELFNSVGTFISATTTNGSGVYAFDGLANGIYTVRVVNGSIASTRGGCAAGTCLPVQTYRTDASSGAAVPVTDHVGGEDPTVADAGNSTTTLPAAAQSITTVTKGAASVAGVDFGFNFDTIVSIRDAGQGSLRQFILNANALTGADSSIFMIPNGLANPGQNTSYTNQLTSGGANSGAAVITLTSALPTISGANTTLDGSTQTSNVGDTNPGTVGTGGTVGTMAMPLPRFERPEVVIAAAATRLIASGASVIIKGLTIANGGITVSGNNSEVRDCLAGMNADSTVTTIYSGGYAITIGAGSGILISHNYTKVNNSSIRGDAPGANAVIEFNEVDSPAGTPGGGHTLTYDGILVINAATNATVRYNLTKNQRGGGIEFGFGTGAVTGTVLGNTVISNGWAGGAPSTEPLGIAFYSLAAGSAVTVQENLVTGNAAAGVTIIPSAGQTTSGILMTQNSIYGNNTIGIELNVHVHDPNTYQPDGVTINDMNDADTGPNSLLNYPIIENAVISGGNLLITGWARPGSVIEFFLSDKDVTNFGEGKTYLTTLTEGSGADSDATVSTYGPATINGTLQGSDTTNRFAFSIPVPVGVANGTALTATATLAGNTSEFSGNAPVGGLPTLTKAFTPTAIGVGQAATLSFTISNPNGAVARTGLTFTDTFPADLVIASTPTVVNGCGGTPTITATAGSGVFTLGGSGVTAAAGPFSCTISVQVTSSVANSSPGYVNGAAQITAISSLLLNGVTDQTLVVVIPPNLTVLKFANKATAKPGEDITYQIITTNTGAGKAWEVGVTDFLSPYSAFKLGSIVFADGGIASGLSLTGSVTSYSYDNGASWTTTPPADLGGGYNGTVTNWKLLFDPAVQMNANNASFTISYQVKVK